MRITNGMIAANTIRNLNKAQVRLATVNEQISSNEKIQLASDDPMVATRAVTYRNYVSQVAQYQDNVSAAQGWQTTTDDALSSVSNVITDLKSLTTKAASSTSATSSIKSEVETDLSELLSDMNTDYVGSYVFGGYNTTSKPYQTESTSIGDTITYNGEYLNLGGVISSDISDSTIESYLTANSSNGYNTLSKVASTAYSAYQTAESLAAASPADTTLAAKATAAQTMYDTLNTAISTYGGTTNLKDAADSAQTTADTLSAAATTYSGDTLETAVTAAYSAYTTAKAAADASSSDTTLAAALGTAKTTYDALNTAYTTTYGSSSTVTVEAAATDAKTTADTLTKAVSNSAQNIKYNVGFSSQVTVNTNGQDVTGQGTNNIFNTIQKLLLALNGDTSYKTATMDSSGTVTVQENSLNISDLIDEFSTGLSRVTVAQSTIGARENNVTTASDRLAEASTTYKGLMTDNENIDTAEATTELSSAEYTYEATLSISAKSISKSLIDYLS